MTYKVSDFIQAIPGTRGIKTAIAQKVGCDRDTVAKWISESPSVHKAWLNERMMLKDMAYSGLVDHLQRKEWKAIAFTLIHMQDDDGSVKPPTQRTDVTSGGEPLETAVTIYQLPDNDRDNND